MKLTAAYLGVASLVYAYLVGQVVKQRWRLRVSLGDGTSQWLLDVVRAVAEGGKGVLEDRSVAFLHRSKYWALLAAVRAHANFIEYSPLVFLSTALAEANGMPSWALHALLGSFVVGRVAHATTLTGTKAGVGLGRALGTATALIVLTVAGVFNIMQALA